MTGAKFYRKEFTVYSSDDIAKYFLSLADEEAGDLISNMKLQKLVYYAQGFHLAMHDAPLFDEPIRAWQHGPVIPRLYYKYKDNGPCHIPVPGDFDPAAIDQETRNLLDEVYTVFGQYSAWKLRNMTHEEPPWRDAEADEDISHEMMKDYFRTLLIDAEEA